MVQGSAVLLTTACNKTPEAQQWIPVSQSCSTRQPSPHPMTFTNIFSVTHFDFHWKLRQRRRKDYGSESKEQTLGSTVQWCWKAGEGRMSFMFPQKSHGFIVKHLSRFPQSSSTNVYAHPWLSCNACQLLGNRKSACFLPTHNAQLSWLFSLGLPVTPGHHLLSQGFCFQAFLDHFLPQ